MCSSKCGLVVLGAGDSGSVSPVVSYYGTGSPPWLHISHLLLTLLQVPMLSSFPRASRLTRSMRG